MHQVYDDEMTFKLVAAASNVSGLPVEVCLEEFGKHFLVYCQKNGYDQILRVLGSNLYDFLTNLDNLHDHLASIYPGMRAPSFRVTRHMNTNRHKSATGAEPPDGRQVADKQPDRLGQMGTGDELHRQNASCSLLAGSMYLHYYSERAGLSPIVKGLVMAVAKEFFQTDILVTECKPDLDEPAETTDDHVVLKIDRRQEVDLEEAKKEKVDRHLSVEQQAAADARQQVAASVDLVQSDYDTRQPQLNQSKCMLNIYDSLSSIARDSLVNSEIMMQTFPFHVIFDRQFNLVQVGKSLLRATSFYWQRRQADQDERRSIGESAVSLEPVDGDELVKFSDLFDIVRPKIEFTFDAIADHTNQVFVVRTRPLVLNADYRRLSSGSAGSSGGAGGQTDPSRRPTATGAAELTAASQVRPRQRHSGPEQVGCAAALAASQRLAASSMCPFNRLAANARRRSSPANRDDKQLAGNDNQNQDEPAEQEEQSNIVDCKRGHSSRKTELTATAADCRDEEDPVGGHQVKSSSVAGIAHANANCLSHSQLLLALDPDELNDAAAANHLSLRLKGQMIILLGGELCLYLCSPRVDHLDQLMECGVKMSDFALHDRARELMLMSHTHKEDREAVKKLDQASNDLKKMDTKLRQENKRTNEVLHNIFPAKIAALLSHGHQVESESFDLVTCLYSDIIGFTKMCGSENVKPIDIVRLLNTLYLQFDNLTNIHNVFKVETIGDAYVVVGGLPEPAEDHADRCVKMGLDMVKVIGTVRSPADNEPIQMRIGIHSGPVMAGIVGIRVPRYSLFGNTTTLANQLETHGVGGKIHISDFTLKNLIKRDRFVVENNPVQVTSVPFVTYFVTNYLSDEIETLKHERILEEQLIKDFELMGNELELVDDSMHQQLVTTAPAIDDGALPDCANSLQQQQQRRGSRSDLFNGQNSNSTGRGGAGVGSSLLTAVSNLANEEAASEALRRQAPSGWPPSRPTLVQTLVSDNNQRDSHRNDDEDADERQRRRRQSSERRLLMDIEALEQELWMSRQLSEKLSATIIAEAVEQVRQISGCSQLLLLLANQKAELEVICCRSLTNSHPSDNGSAGSRPSNNPVPKRGSSGSEEKWRETANDSCCPLCNGNGSLDFARKDLIRLKLEPTRNGNKKNATSQVGELPTASGGGGNFPEAKPIVRDEAKLTPISGVFAAGQLSASDIGRQLLTDARSQLAERLLEWLEENVAPLRTPGEEQVDVAGPNPNLKPLERMPGQTDLVAARGRSTCSAEIGGGGGSSDAHSRLGELAAAAAVDDLRNGEEGGLLEQVRRNYGHRRKQSIERLLIELRDERLSLVAERTRLQQQQWRQEPANGPRRPDLQAGKLSGSSRPLGGAQREGVATRIGVSRELNSSIQRMKRMDTLKRRKLKKEQQLKQEVASANSSEPVGGSSIRFARPLTESVLASANSKVCLAGDPLIAEEEDDDDYDDDDEEDCEEERDDRYDDDDDGRDGRDGRQYRDGNANGAIRGTANDGDHYLCGLERKEDERRPKGRRPPNSNQSGQASSDGDLIMSGAHSAVSKSKVDNGELTERMAPPGGQSGRQVARETSPPKGRSAATKKAAGTNDGTVTGATENRRTSAYSYQGLRSSLASLVNEVAEQGRKKKFSNPFSNRSIAAALNSLGSPIKRAQQKQAAANVATVASPAASMVKGSTGGPPVGSSPVQPASKRKLDSRQHSSRSQSSGSAGATPSSPRQPTNRIARGSNCSCLKSSASSQSGDWLPDNDDQRHQPSQK